jgi:small-conductance mechanosensitive channel
MSVPVSDLATAADCAPTTPFDLLDRLVTGSAARLADLDAVCQPAKLDPLAVETALIHASIEGAQVLLDRVRLYERATRVPLTDALCAVLDRYDELAWQIATQIRELEQQRQLEKLTVAQRQRVLGRARAAHRRLLNMQGQMALALARLEQGERQEADPARPAPATIASRAPAPMPPAPAKPPKPASRPAPPALDLPEPELVPDEPSTVEEAMNQLTDLLDNMTTLLETRQAAGPPTPLPPSSLPALRAALPARKPATPKKKSNGKKTGKHTKRHH